MQHTPRVSEEQLEVNSAFAETRSILPELMFRLISASVQNPTELRIPYGGSAGQSGWDGLVSSPVAFDPYVPEGASAWEFGAGDDPQDKATQDFKKRTDRTSPAEKAVTTFVFVTTRSGSRKWNLDQQRVWLEGRATAGWKDIRIIDGTRLAQWLALFPEIDFWLADRFGLPVAGLVTPALYWENLSKYGDPPPLKPEVFTAGRANAKNQLLQLLDGRTNELRLESRYPAECIDFVCAVLAGLDPPTQAAYSGRCLLIKDPATWEAMSSLRTPHILVGDPALDLGGSGADLRQQARRRHRVIFACPPSGNPHGNAVRLPEYPPYELEKSLVGSGYKAERARQLSLRCGGSIFILKRLLLDVSASPDWATGTTAGDMKIAALIGRWDGANPSDRQIVESLMGKAYGEWIEVIHQTALRSNAPLMQRNDKWRFISRFEGWQFLGALLSRDDLYRLGRQSVAILREIDSSLDLPPADRWASGLHGSHARHSPQIREGVAETLALLACYPSALTSVARGHALATADVAVRDILAAADWTRWASLQDVLPLLAEASPDQLLKAVEHDLAQPEPSIVALFGQETPGVTGRTYITGLLWALETLAWHPDHLVRVALILAQLAARDPGGNWANRPSNSLATIFLPWLPQTTAPSEKRVAALRTLLRESRDVGWKLLLELLPDAHQASSGSRKPVWREWISSAADERVTEAAYHEEIRALAELALEVAISDLAKFTALTERLPYLPLSAFKEILATITSRSATDMNDADRFALWQTLSDLVAQHRRFPDADWTLPPEMVNAMAAAADAITPKTLSWRYRRWFAGKDFDLFETDGNYDEQQATLAATRKKAVVDLYTKDGVEGLLDFAQGVQEPWKVGHSLAGASSAEIDHALLPRLLSTDSESLLQFIAGYTWGRFWQEKWPWAQMTARGLNTPAERITFLNFLPFVRETWDLARELLADQEAEFWRKSRANAFDAAPSDLPDAIHRLLEVHRPMAALYCLDRMLHEQAPVAPELAATILEQLAGSNEEKRSLDGHKCQAAIAWLQKNPPEDRQRLQRIEWTYLPLLDRHSRGAPRMLEQELADNPEFFCEVIRGIYRAAGQPKPEQGDVERESRARNAYRLLHTWRTIPGQRADGSVDEAHLLRWLATVKESAGKSGHLRAAMIHFGNVLAHAPADADGTWICHPVARIVDAPDAEKIREGFSLEKFNRRGFHFSSKGKAEKDLAGGYRQQADAVEALYPRLATTMRGLAESYDRMSEREAHEDPFND